MFGVDWPSASGDITYITYLTCHVTQQVHVIEDYMMLCVGAPHCISRPCQV